jgi:hypothetical protein
VLQRALRSKRSGRGSERFVLRCALLSTCIEAEHQTPHTTRPLPQNREYDFDSDESWVAYLKRIDMAGPGDLAKVKAKWWKKEKDPDFDVAAALRPANSSSAPLPTSTSSSSQQPQAAPRQPPHQQQQPSAPRAAGAGAAPSVGGWAGWLAQLLGDQDQVLFTLNVGVSALDGCGHNEQLP